MGGWEGGKTWSGFRSACYSICSTALHSDELISREQKGREGRLACCGLGVGGGQSSMLMLALYCCALFLWIVLIFCNYTIIKLK